jgi:hypothetical protein
MLLVVQSLAEQEQAQTGLLRKAANAHTEAAMAREVKLQVEVAAAHEIQRQGSHGAPGAQGCGQPKEEVGGRRAKSQ